MAIIFNYSLNVWYSWLFIYLHEFWRKKNSFLSTFLVKIWKSFVHFCTGQLGQFYMMYNSLQKWNKALGVAICCFEMIWMIFKLHAYYIWNTLSVILRLVFKNKLPTECAKKTSNFFLILSINHVLFIQFLLSWQVTKFKTWYKAEKNILRPSLQR